MGATETQLKPELIHPFNCGAWKIKQFDRFDTYFLHSIAWVIIISYFFRYTDDGVMIATMFNQNFQWNAQNNC